MTKAAGRIFICWAFSPSLLSSMTLSEKAYATDEKINRLDYFAASEEPGV